MQGIIKGLLVAGLLFLAVLSYGCAGTNYSGEGPQINTWDYNGDLYSPYPPYHRPNNN